MEAAEISQAVRDKYSSIAHAASTTSKPSCCKPQAARSAISQNDDVSNNKSTINGSCCKTTTITQPSANNFHHQTNNHHNNGFPTDYATRVAASFGYPPSLLSSLPPNTNLGLSCGNPLALTNIAPTETIIDLGSGGGLDCLVAAQAMVKATQSTDAPLLTGKVIGIDSSEAMVALAKRNADAARLPARSNDAPCSTADEDTADHSKNSQSLVSFIHSEITNIPLPSRSANLITSNCVLNLLSHAQKPRCFREIYRLLRPSGRVAISDILALKPLPDSLRSNIALLVGCVAGAASVDEYRTWMIEAGFDETKIIFRANGSDLNAYKLTAEEREAQMQAGNGGGCCGGGGGCGANVREDGRLFDEEVRDIDFNEYVAAFEIYAVK